MEHPLDSLCLRAAAPGCSPTLAVLAVEGMATKAGGLALMLAVGFQAHGKGMPPTDNLGEVAQSKYNPTRVVWCRVLAPPG